MKNIYNLTLPPIKKLTIRKIVIYSIHGKCCMCNWRIGQEGQWSYSLGGFSHSYLHRQSQPIAISGASRTSSSPWSCPFALYGCGHIVSCWVVSDFFVAPWAVACQAPLSVGFPRQEYWSGLPFPPPGHLPSPGIELMSSALAGGFFTLEPPGKPCGHVTTTQMSSPFLSQFEGSMHPLPFLLFSLQLWAQPRVSFSE